MEKKFIVAQKTLYALLGGMQPICNKRTTLDVTESILFQVMPRELTLKTTDLEISLQSTMELDSDLTEGFSFLISGRRIFELVKEMDQSIECTLAGNQLHLRSGAVELALNIKDAEDFPPFPERIENLMNIEAPHLIALLNKVAFLIPQNNTNQALNGLLLEVGPQAMSMVATDGHCLAKVQTAKYTLPDEKKWLLPKRAVLEIKKLVESNAQDNVFLGVCGNQLVFSGKNFNFFTKLISEAFPQYQPVMDKEGFMPARVAKDPFLKTLKRASCLLAGQFVSTNFTFTPGTVSVNLHNKEVGKLDESLVLEGFDGNPIESRFYSPYLLNGLQVFAEGQLTFMIKNGAKPIIFEAEGSDYQLTYLVMPVSMAQGA
ncbi:MAG: DNA polymerase III subunit beta [Candidatus Babeliales bacterium]